MTTILKCQGAQRNIEAGEEQIVIAEERRLAEFTNINTATKTFENIIHKQAQDDQ